MGLQTKIQWTDATINFWHGCNKVSDGCKFCYMHRDKARYGQDPNRVVKSSEPYIKANLRKLTEPSKIFTCSWSDFFIKEADEWRPWAWDIIKKHPQHQWQILTKRPERIKDCLPADWNMGYENVWLLISAENQATYDERIVHLNSIPAKVKGLSLEPLLSHIQLHSLERINWIILGGESGNDTGYYRYRKSELKWYEDIIQTASMHNIPVFVKQLGTYLAKELAFKNDRHGGSIEHFPKKLQIRNFPDYR